MSLVKIYLDAVTHQVITSEELAYLVGNQDCFDGSELKLSARLESLISSGTISVGSRLTATRTKQQFLNVFNNPTH